MSSKPPTRPRRASVWSTASVRLALAFSLLFGLGGALLIAGIDYGLMRFAEHEVREGLEHQMAVMRADADRLGGAGLVRMLDSQPRNREARRYMFLVIAPDGSQFSNGLRPAAVSEGGFRRNLPTKHRAARWPDQTPNLLVLSARASDGTLLAIGRDTEHLDDLRGGIRRFALWSGLILLALAMLGGLTIGWLFLRRLENVNRAVARIIAGREVERLPAIGFGREFDELAANLNRMLDRQEAVLTALKTMSEAIAHELRAPLNRLRNRLEEIELDSDGPSRAAAMQVALEEMDQVNALFDSLLALTRIETGAAPLKRARLDAAGLARTVGEIYRPVVEEAGGRLVLSPEAAPLPVDGDANLLQQAMANLIENAVFHGGEAPTVTVSATAEADETVLSVGDDGPGIPPDEREKVTRRFYRLSRSGSRASSGLGLAMVAAVARAHGGDLRLEDNGPGLKASLRLPSGGVPRDDAGQ